MVSRRRGLALLGMMLMAGCGGGGDDPPDAAAGVDAAVDAAITMADASADAATMAASQVVGAAGGTVAVTDPTSPLLGTQVVIPPGALATPTTITIGTSTTAASLGLPGSVLVTDFGPSGTVFAQPVTITIKYRAQYLTDGQFTDPRILKVVAMAAGRARETLRTTAQDTSALTISARTTHFTPFAALGPSAATLNGDYFYASTSYASSTPQQGANTVGSPQLEPRGFEVEIGTARFDGTGGGSFTATRNLDGVGAPMGGSFTYAVAPDGTYSADNMRGGVLAGGSLLVFGTSSGTPRFALGLKKGGSFTTATAIGTYFVETYSFVGGPQPSAQTQGLPQQPPLGFVSETGVAVLDGNGGGTYTVTRNLDGSASSISLPFSYSVAADGTYTAGNHAGGLLEGGSMLVFGTTSGSPRLSFAIRKEGTFATSDLSGVYTMLSRYYKGGAQPQSSAPGSPQQPPAGFAIDIGTATLDGMGGGSFAVTTNIDTVASPFSGSFSYSVAADGTYTAGNFGGGVLAGGAVILFGSTSGTPRISLAILR